MNGGLPRCGGGCCSRACAPWGPTGALVCQPASGCHVNGDLCDTEAMFALKELLMSLGAASLDCRQDGVTNP